VHDMHVLDLYIAGCSPFWHLRWTRTEFRRSFPFSIVMHALQGEREREWTRTKMLCSLFLYVRLQLARRRTDAALERRHPTILAEGYRPAAHLGR
jgi:hypothetical protein